MITGAKGFIGRHLTEALRRRGDLRVIESDLGTPPEVLEEGLREADIIYHLAGVNRPQDPAEFASGNVGFTQSICSILSSFGRQPLIVISSSIQADLDNPYGVSKRGAEEVLRGWAKDTGGRVAIFRLKNVFGKWCRPNYNSVTATFCYNIAHGLPIHVNDPTRELDLVYIDDVVKGFLSVDGSTFPAGSAVFCDIAESHKTTLGTLAGLLETFRRSRETLEMPSLGDSFTRRLYGTYLTYLDGDKFGYALEQKTDSRGSLAEFIKQPHFGQIFVSRTCPGVTRGNHYHHTKTEKFFVVEGEAIVRFRSILGGDVIEYRVSGTQFKVIDIPPGYAHSIENVGSTDLVTLFWAVEIFDPARPDVYARNVL